MMNNELRPYELRPVTDIPWIESIPAHWDVQRGKAVYKKLNRPTRSNDEVVTCFRDGVVTLRKNRRTTGFTESIKEIGYQGIRKGDLVIHVMDAFAGAIGVSDSDGKGTPVYSVCESKVDLNNYYYAYVIREMAKTGFIQSLYRGIRERSSDFRFEVFANQYLPIPPLSEQDQIVKYLDHQLAKINKFIKTKKKLIAVLKEQKQAIINEAVTKGLDTSVKMKSSGIKWIGDVPEHWKVTPLKRILEVKMTDGPHETPTFLDYGIPFVSADAVQDGKLHLKRMRGYISQEDHKKYCEKIKPQINDIFIVKSGSTTGKSCIVDFEEEFSVWSPLALVRTKQEFEPYFVFNAICSTYFQKQVENKWSFGTQPNIGMGVLQNLIITIPDYTEQIVIAKTIKERTTGIDGAIKKINDEIDLINEYKNSLISDVVTGKVDVRNIVIDGNEEEIIEDTELVEDSIDDESLEAEDGDE